MPRTNREYLLRFHGALVNDLDSALGYLKRMSEMYSPEHPEHTEFLEGIAQVIIKLQELLTDFRTNKM